MTATTLELAEFYTVIDERTGAELLATDSLTLAVSVAQRLRRQRRRAFVRFNLTNKETP